MENKNGYIFYNGVSMIDPSETVIGIITIGKSANSKIGDMIQIWFLVLDLHPAHAIKHGQAVSICGDCVHFENGTCYVSVNPIAAVWKAYHRGNYTCLYSFDRLPENLKEKNTRVGAYGDPASVPSQILIDLLTAINPPVQTGYTHQWRKREFSILSAFNMASCETNEQAKIAQSKNWRTFTSLPDSVMPMKRDLLCVETDRGISCADCGLCCGNRLQSARSIYNHSHGFDYKVKRIADHHDRTVADSIFCDLFALGTDHYIDGQLSHYNPFVPMIGDVLSIASMELSIPATIKRTETDDQGKQIKREYSLIVANGKNRVFCENT